MEQASKENIFNLLLVLLYVFIFVFLFSFQNLNKYFYNNQLDNLFNYDYINFYEFKVENGYQYFDYNSVFNNVNNHTISADIYLENNISTKSILDYNYKHKEIDALTGNEALVSFNLANEHDLKIGDSIYIYKDKYIIKDFLPPLKGFNPKTNREGIIKLNQINEENLESNYISFDEYEKWDAIYSISLDEYKANSKYYISIIILVLNCLIILIIPYYISKVLHSKTRIYYLEGKRFYKIYLSNLYNITIKNFLIMFIGILSYYILFTSKLYTNHLLSVYSLIIGQYLLLNIVLTYIYTRIWRKKDI